MGVLDLGGDRYRICEPLNSDLRRDEDHTPPGVYISDSKGPTRSHLCLSNGSTERDSSCSRVPPSSFGPEPRPLLISVGPSFPLHHYPSFFLLYFSFDKSSVNCVEGLRQSVIRSDVRGTALTPRNDTHQGSGSYHEVVVICYGKESRPVKIRG